MNRSGTSAVSGQNPWVSKQKSMRIAAVAVIIESLKSSQRYVWSLGWFFCRARKGAIRNRNISGLEPKRQGFGRLGSGSLCVGFWAGLRVSEFSNIRQGFGRFTFEVLMCRFLGQFARFQRSIAQYSFSRQPDLQLLRPSDSNCLWWQERYLSPLS